VTPSLGATLSVAPPSQTVAPGSVSVDIDVTGALSLGAYEFQLEWDPAVLGFVAVTNGPFLGSTGNSVFCPAPTVDTVSSLHHLTFTCTATGVVGPSGSGTLATVQFATNGAGTTTLDLHDGVLTTLLLVDLPASESDGTVTVVVPTPTPAPTSTPNATTVTLGAAEAAWIDEDNPADAHGNEQTVTVDGEQGKVKRALFRYDVSSLPPGATVVSAALSLCMLGANGGASGHTHELHAATSAWDENTTWQTRPTISAAATDSFPVPSSAQCVTLDVAADVQAWVDGTPNLGWQLDDEDETQGNPSDVRYAAHTHATTPLRPALTIAYAP
jgi:general secretion pathway protein D